MRKVARKAALMAVLAGGMMMARTDAVEDPRAPYVVRLGGWTESPGRPLEPLVMALPGVEKVALDRTAGTLSIHTSPSVFLSESALARAVAPLGLRVEAVELPDWATVTLWVARASGGG